MKTKALYSVYLLLLSFSLISFSDPYSIKRISDKDFRYEFYTTDKKIKTKSDKIYYWFKGGLIHNAQAGIAGELLNEKFTKMYHSNQLAEQGYFKNGLKNGLWKTWHKNGMIETTQKWSNGVRTGKFYHFNEDGLTIQKGKYKRGNKHDVWIDFIKKDTLKYKNGIIFIKKIKPSKEERRKQKEEKQKIKEAKKLAKQNSKPEEKVENTVEEKSNKKSFLKNLFKKKQSNPKVND